MNRLPYLDSHAEDDLREAIRITNARMVEHISPDNCQRCGGLGCDDCRDCQCPRNTCKRKRSGR